MIEQEEESPLLRLSTNSSKLSQAIPRGVFMPTVRRNVGGLSCIRGSLRVRLRAVLCRVGDVIIDRKPLPDATFFVASDRKKKTTRTVKEN